jgi:hypothetical protein
MSYAEPLRLALPCQSIYGVQLHALIVSSMIACLRPVVPPFWNYICALKFRTYSYNYPG